MRTRSGPSSTARNSKRGAVKNLAALEGQATGPQFLDHLDPKERFAKIPYWYAVNTPPPASADPEGYMKTVPKGQTYMCYANVLGIKPWVVKLLKKVLRWRYMSHERTLGINLRRQDDKNRLTEEINITFRNYATELNKLLRTGQILPERLPGKMKHYEAMEELSAKVEKIGSYRVSGYLLYKIAEGLMKEVIEEKRALIRRSTSSGAPGKSGQPAPKRSKRRGQGWTKHRGKRATRVQAREPTPTERLIVRLKISPEKLGAFQDKPKTIRLKLKASPEKAKPADDNGDQTVLAGPSHG
ncbi:hypothetical protein TWF281_006625 [Arthrobotrys megalospora]